MIDLKPGLAALLAAFDRLAIPYFITGSIASSAYGNFRYTNDIDFVADLRMDQVGDFAASLQGEFYADEQMMRSALLHRRAFNVIHFASSYKFDIYPLLPDDFHRSTMARRRTLDLAKVGMEGMHAQASSVEDTILAKLDWYKGGGVSDQKWHDLMCMVKVQGDALDREYLRYWAQRLGVADLLDELLT